MEGELTFYTETDTIVATAGVVVHLRRETPHAFVVESERARFLVLGMPAYQDAFFQAAGTPTPESGPPDFARMAAIAAEHGIELLGPPPNVPGAGIPAHA